MTVIMALAGRRIDAPDAVFPRFPLVHVDTVRTRLRDLLVTERAESLVCSAACGADLLALEVAGGLQIRRRILLPFGRDEFRLESVVDRPGDWGSLFDQVCDDVAARGDLVVLDAVGTHHEGYARVTAAIIDEALRLAQQARPGQPEILAVAVWDGEARGPDDLTALFLQHARAQGLPVREILTR